MKNLLQPNLQLNMAVSTELQADPLYSPTMGFSPFSPYDELYQDINAQRKNILLVDDSLRAIAPLNLIFKNLGCNTILSFDYVQASDELLKADIDLVILDWNLPGGTGGDTIKLTQATLDNLEKQWHINKKKTPVVIYSGTSSLKIDIPKCRSFDVVDYWQKPLDYPSIIRKATKILKDS